MPPNRMSPPSQGLASNDLVARQRDDRLIEDSDLFGFDSDPEVMFERAPFLGFLLHCRLEEAERSPASGFGDVHREIRILEQFLAGSAVLGGKGDTILALLVSTCSPHGCGLWRAA